MAFDKPTRNRLASFVSEARNLIANEFTQQFQSIYGISEKGEVTALEHLGHLDDTGLSIAMLLRERIEYLVRTHPGEKDGAKSAVDRLTREQAFTVLNRLAALRMAEKRDLIVESVGKGYQSKGFKVFEQVAGSGLGDTYSRYRRYLYCLFDELAVDLGVLFDRSSPQGLLFPREPALLELVKLLNAPDLDTLWTEDETIGWVYQYYNDPGERKKMRDESAAPRNSRELAVRNQFFTPRYVVEFLTDNTLGRIWYEMTQGETRLKEQCRYLVRRPKEIFLKVGEAAPEVSPQDGLSQEELLKQPVYIPHRSLKDPREIRMLDPACGSMHFGLYAFDLFEVIYDEAWEIAHGNDTVTKSSTSFTSFVSFAATYPDKAAFVADVPRLIIEHNIHGIDIDPRCAQIAGLSLWLRAQKSWRLQKLAVGQRPRIRKSNIVCAEPMPGDKAMREFVQNQFSASEQPAFSHLLETIFDKMQLAGEAGSLLKIEEEIRSAVDEARTLWKRGQNKPELFSTEEINRTLRPGAQQRLAGLEQAVSQVAKDFWETAEESIYVALRDYAEQAENGGGFQRRLFAEDAAKGFAFIDLCRKHYDVAVMNPPFGDCTEAAKPLIFASYGRERIELGGCFITRFAAGLVSDGKLGVIANRTLLFAASLDEWRLQKLAGAEAVLDLGHGVLDALVETACVTLGRCVALSTLFVGALDAVTKDEHIASSIQHAREGKLGRGLFRRVSEFRGLFGAPFAYWAPASLIAKASQLKRAEDVQGIARQGLATCDNFRFLRLAHELPVDAKGWIPLTKGGEYQPFWADVPLRVKWSQNGREVKAYIDWLHGQWSRVVQSTNLYGLPGATYSERTASSLSLRVLPRDSIFDKVGPFVGAECEQRSIAVALGLIGMSYTTPYRFLIETSVGLRDATTSGSAARHYLPSMIQRLPWPECSKSDQVALEEATRGAIEAARELDAVNEPNGFWHEPLAWSDFTSINGLADARLLRWCMILERTYGYAQPLEEIGLRIFGIDESDQVALEAVAGRSVLSYERRAVSDPAELQRLLDLPAEDLIAELAAAGKAHSTTYKKSYWGDRNLELVSHLWEIHPLSLLDALKGRTASPKWVAETAWRVLSASLGFVFGYIQPSDFFRPTVEVLPEDLFCLKRDSKLKDQIREDQRLNISCEDPTHRADLVGCLEQVLKPYFQGRALDQILSSVNDSQQNLRRFVSQQLFARHLSDYSNYRRQAPIYWQLSTASGSYTLWIYYHRLTENTLHSALADFIDPKLKSLRDEISYIRDNGNQQARLEELRNLEQDLLEFRAEVERIIKLPWKPNLSDGVLITASPLWKLFRLPKWQKDLKACWEKLSKGEYDWAHLAYTIWPDRVKEVCKTDRSIAIAHGLEHLCKVEAPKPKKRRMREEEAGFEDLEA